MREFEASEKYKKYTKERKLSKKTLFGLYMVVLVLFLLTILTKNNLMLFLFVIIFTSIVNYHTNVQTIRFNPALEVILSLLITRVMGLSWSLVMIFIPILLIDAYTARLDKDTFISLFFTGLINVIMSLLPTVNFIILALILIVVKFLAGLLANMALDISPQEMLFEHLLGFITNIIFVLSFGQILIYLFI